MNENIGAYPVSPVACIIAIGLAIKVVHITRRPLAGAGRALAKLEATLSVDTEVAFTRLSF